MLQQYTHLRQKAIWGGNLHSIVEAVLEAVTDIVNSARDPSCLEIDVTVVWMGNELCGRRGVFLDPGMPSWQIGPEGYAAEGLWPEIAGRVCGEISRLAALKGRPCVGSVQILGDADPIDYDLPPEYREAIQKFSGYARSRGIYTHSIRTAVSAIPKHDHYHFREDSTHRATLANCIAHRIRVAATDNMFAKLPTHTMEELKRRFPYDEKRTVVHMAYVFDRQLHRAQLSRRLQRQAEIKEAQERCPDPWENEYVPPADEPVTGMREVPAYILEWERVRDLEEAKRRVVEQASRPSHLAPLSGGPSGSSAGITEVSFDDVIDSIPYRTEAHRTFSAVKENMINAAKEKGFMQSRPGDFVGMRYEDDLDLCEMIDCPRLPPGTEDPEGEGMVHILQEAIPRDHLPPHSLRKNDQTHLTGLVRGAKSPFKTRVGKWVQIAEVIDVMWKTRHINMGTRTLLSICADDSKGRFILSGHPDADPRGEFIDGGIWPTWIAASHGHNVKIASQVEDSAIAIAWFSAEERTTLGDTAAFEGRPYLAKGEYPPRLYHRTTHDAAFAIIESGFQPGYGSSGKIHAYFATATLNELENRAGSRANLPYELVVSTDEALQHAYLFETTSEGILTRDTVPGSCVLYVRDTLKNVIVWTRSDPNDTEEAIVMDAPPPTVEESPGGDDGIFPESFEGAPAPLSGGLETDQITKEEIAPGIVKPELPAILDSTASDMLPRRNPFSVMRSSVLRPSRGSAR